MSGHHVAEILPRVFVEDVQGDEVEFLRDWDAKKKPKEVDALAGKGG